MNQRLWSWRPIFSPLSHRPTNEKRGGPGVLPALDACLRRHYLDGGAPCTSRPEVDAIVLRARRTRPPVQTGRQIYCFVPTIHFRHSIPHLPASLAGARGLHRSHGSPIQIAVQKRKARGPFRYTPALCGHRIASSDYGGEHLPVANGRLLATHDGTANSYVPAASFVCDSWCNAIATIVGALYQQSECCQTSTQSRHEPKGAEPLR